MSCIQAIFDSNYRILFNLYISVDCKFLDGREHISLSEYFPPYLEEIKISKKHPQTVAINFDKHLSRPLDEYIPYDWM